MSHPDYNSEGRLIHPTAEGRAAFWRWFGNSKVVDDQGRPLVVYRGTSGPSVHQTTLPAISFAPIPTVASVYSSQSAKRGEHYPAGASVTPCYLKIERPVVFKKIDLVEKDLFRAIKGLTSIDYKNIMNSKALEHSWYLNSKDEKYYRAYVVADSRVFINIINHLGYDGIQHKDVFIMGRKQVHRLTGEDPRLIGLGPSSSHWTFRPLRHNQIKSAVGNRGTFDDSDVMTNPLVHHGTKARFDIFTTDTVAMNHGMECGWGIYFTSDPVTALAYAGAGGHLYTIKVPNGPWLPWVGRVKSPAARRAVQRAFESLRGKGLTWGGGIPVEEFIDRHAAHRFDSSGGCVYRDLAVALDDNVGDKVSKLLRACGIVGISYRQRQVRLKDGTVTPEGAKNFVVFDPKDIRYIKPV